MISFCTISVTEQMIFLLQVRQSRDPEEVKKCLAAIQECAQTKEGNLLALAVEAARARSKIICHCCQPFPRSSNGSLIIAL